MFYSPRVIYSGDPEKNQIVEWTGNESKAEKWQASKVIIYWRVIDVLSINILEDLVDI